jgi:hypothetical protein
VSFDTEGPQGFSAASALGRFGAERLAVGAISGRGNTIFRVSLSYRGRTRVVCKYLVVDVNLKLRSEDGSFDETLAAELTVYSIADDARVSAGLPAGELRGSYRDSFANQTAQSLAFELQYKPNLTGWIALVPAAAGSNSVVATFTAADAP